MRALDQIIDAKFERYADQVIRRLRRMPTMGMAGDDHPARTVWDLWKLEMQDEHSIGHDALRDTIDAIIGGLVAELDWEETALLTIDDDSREPEDEDEAEAVANADFVAERLASIIDGKACNEPHRREVQRMLDGASLDRHVRDNEGYRSA